MAATAQHLGRLGCALAADTCADPFKLDLTGHAFSCAACDSVGHAQPEPTVTVTARSVKGLRREDLSLFSPLLRMNQSSGGSGLVAMAESYVRFINHLPSAELLAGRLELSHECLELLVHPDKAVRSVVARSMGYLAVGGDSSPIAVMFAGTRLLSLRC